jgi:hypothetical protein
MTPEARGLGRLAARAPGRSRGQGGARSRTRTPVHLPHPGLAEPPPSREPSERAREAGTSPLWRPRPSPALAEEKDRVTPAPPAPRNSAALPRLAPNGPCSGSHRRLFYSTFLSARASERGSERGRAGGGRVEDECRAYIHSLPLLFPLPLSFSFHGLAALTAPYLSSP